MEVGLKPQIKFFIVFYCVILSGLSESAYGLDSNKDLKLDDGAGDSPSVVLTDQADAQAQLQKVQGGGAEVSTSEGPIKLRPSGASSNSFQFETTSSNPTFSFLNGDANASGLRLNSVTKKLEYRDENNATWSPLDSFAGQSSLDSLTTTVGTKADQSTVNMLSTTVATKADQSTVTTLSTTKADQTTVNALSTVIETKTKGWTISAQTDSFTVLPEDKHMFYVVNNSSEVIATLPLASAAGVNFMVSVRRGGVSDVILIPSGTDKIDGHDRLRLKAFNAKVTLITDGSNWYLFDVVGYYLSYNLSGTCPVGYVTVPGNTQYGTDNFCVAKYEMKGGTLSEPSGNPVVNINQTTAKAACTALGAGYHLVTNNEWMTVARNIENTAANWSSGVVGAGALNRGHSDSAPANSLPANADDNQACEGTGQPCSSTIWDGQRRTHVLSNGEVIWDLAGNVLEWNDWNVPTADKASPQAAWIEIGVSTPTVSMPQVSYYPEHTTYTAAQGIGMYYPGNSGSGGAARRGGDWGSGTSAGVFSLGLGYGPSGTYADVGFRCALQ